MYVCICECVILHLSTHTHRLYNKETVLLSLLDKSAMPEVARHIRSLKDIVPLVLTANPSYKPNGEMADAYNDVQAARFVCPVAGLEMSGRYRCVCVCACLPVCLWYVWCVWIVCHCVCECVCECVCVCV